MMALINYTAINYTAIPSYYYSSDFWVGIRFAIVPIAMVCAILLAMAWIVNKIEEKK